MIEKLVFTVLSRGQTLSASQTSHPAASTWPRSLDSGDAPIHIILIGHLILSDAVYVPVYKKVFYIYYIHICLYCTYMYIILCTYLGAVHFSPQAAILLSVVSFKAIHGLSVFRSFFFPVASAPAQLHTSSPAPGIFPASSDRRDLWAYRGWGKQWRTLFQTQGAQTLW